MFDIINVTKHYERLYKLLTARSDKDKITFKAIEKYRYGLLKTVSKHLKMNYPLQILISILIITVVHF